MARATAAVRSALAPLRPCALAFVLALAWGCTLDSRTLAADDASLRAPRQDGGAHTAVLLDAPLGRFARHLAPSQRKPLETPDASSAPLTPDGGPDGAAGDARMPAPEPEPPPADAGGDASADAGSDAASTPQCHKLVVSSQWIDDFSNCLEIQGEAFVSSGREDGVMRFHVVSDPICMQEAPPSADGPATLGVYLNQTGPGAPPGDYDARTHRVVGFRFRVGDYLSGEVLPFVGVLSQGEIYCLPTSGRGAYELRLRDLRMRCWESDSGPAPDPEHVTSLLFYYPPSWPGESIGMCLGEIYAIVEPD